MNEWGFPRVSAVLVTPPTVEPITPADLTLRARLDRPDEAALLAGFIAAARQQVERDTDRALLTQTWRAQASGTSVIELPWPPLQRVTKVSVLQGGVVSDLDPAAYVVDTISVPGRLYLTVSADAAIVEYEAGWPDVAQLPPLLVQAVGLMASHMATVGRDATIIGTIIQTNPMGYEEAIAPYRLVGVP